MRVLTGQDEIAFHDPAGGPHTRLAALAASVGGRGIAALTALTLAEWEDALLSLRRALIGPQIESETDCDSCGTGNALAFSLDDLPREPSAALPLDGTPLGPLRLADLIALEERGLQGEPALIALLSQATGMDPAQAEARLTGPDRDTAIAALESAVAGLGLEIGTSCTDCGAALVLPLDVADFLDTELRSRAARLLDEVHLIASSYHWSEAEILGLPSPRRQDYLHRILAAQTLAEVS